MAFYVGSTLIFPNGVLTAPSTTTQGGYLTNDGTNAFWQYPGATSATVGTGWRYRTQLTHGYIAAGYKGYNPWRSVNKTWHLTDTTIYCGEQIDKAAAYLDGTFSDYNAYVHGTSDTWQGAASHTSSYNLSNGVMRMQNNTNFTAFGSGTAPYGYQGQNPLADGITYGTANGAGVGGWDMSVTRTSHGCASSTPGNGASDGAGYVFGGGSATINKIHFPSEVMYSSATSLGTALGAMSCVGGQTQAYLTGGSSNAYSQTLKWSTDTIAAWSFNGAYTDGQNKHLMSKYGWFYAGVFGNTDSRIYKMNDTTGAYISTLSKLGTFGEENQQMGQDWGYMLGMYNNQQNNWTTKTTYSTDAMLTLGPASQPKGHYGTSSGCCSSAAASICGVQRA